ncbi:MAG: YceD family protein [Candidatus Kaelpia aquatica]|nr:YceD family protein [Candidatus Kaelpia aquatica]
MIDALVINIKSVPPEGLKRTLELEPKVLLMDLEVDGSEEAAVAFEGLLRLDMSIEIATGELIIESRIEHILKLFCSRCLDEFKLPFDKNCILNYNIQNSDSIDISDSIREEVILSYPQKPLCREGCAGICLTCRVNLNREECKCRIAEN